jgi:ubiquinone biosynthesis protein
MLQKTLLNIEGLGRELDPDLDLWKTAKPYLERWMSERVGWRGLLDTLKREAPYWAQTLPELPRMLHRLLAEDRLGALEQALRELAAEDRRRNNLLSALVLMLLAGVAVLAIVLLP